MEYYSYYGIEKYTSRRKISDFGVDFSYLQSFFFQRHFQSCPNYRPLTSNACTFYYLIGNRGCNIFECCFILPKTQKMGGGGVAFHNSGHRLARGHVNDMRCLEKYMLFFVWFNSLNNLSDIKGRVYLGWTSAKLGLMCLAQGHNAVTPVSLKPADFRSRVKHSTTEPLHQQITEDPNLKLWNTTDIFIKMSIIYFWCNNASWSLILCAL